MRRRETWSSRSAPSRVRTVTERIAQFGATTARGPEGIGGSSVGTTPTTLGCRYQPVGRTLRCRYDMRAAENETGTAKRKPSIVFGWSNLGSNARLAPAVFILAPVGGQVERAVDQRLAVAAGIAQEHADLAGLDPTSGAAVLPLHRLTSGPSSGNRFHPVWPRHRDRPDAAPHRLAGHRAPHRHPTAPGSGSAAPHLGSHRPPLRPTASRSCAPPAPASPVDKPAPAAAARAVQTAARSDQQRRPGHQPRLAHLFASPCWIASQQR